MGTVGYLGCRPLSVSVFPSEVARFFFLSVFVHLLHSFFNRLYFSVLLLNDLNMVSAAPSLHVFDLEIYHLQLPSLPSLRTEKGDYEWDFSLFSTAIGLAPSSLISYAQGVISQALRACKKVSTPLLKQRNYILLFFYIPLWGELYCLLKFHMDFEGSQIIIHSSSARKNLLVRSYD